MTSTKRLRSVIQSTAHHAMSGLCYVHPHLGDACKKAGITKININLLNAGFDPILPSITKELELSTNALRDKFKELLDVESIQNSEIEYASAIFELPQGRWPTQCYIEVKTNDGKKSDITVDSSGKTKKS